MNTKIPQTIILQVHIIASLFLLNSCSEIPGELNPPMQVDSSIDLLVTKDNVPSDNYSFAEISAITKFRPNANDIIEFRTDKGLFSNDSKEYSVNVSSNDTTRAFLKYNKPDIVRVTATIFNKYSKEVYVNFSTSFPTQILIYPDSSSLQSSLTSKSLITSKLVRRAGIVSEGLNLSYFDSISTSMGGSIGIFLNSTYSDEQGQATVEYWLQDTSYHGIVFIKSFIDTDTGRVEAMNKILIR